MHQTNEAFDRLNKAVNTHMSVKSIYPQIHLDINIKQELIVKVHDKANVPLSDSGHKHKHYPGV
jgi:hypothetical protein